MKLKVVAIVGPTGSGKTSLAIALAKKFNGEIISCDSRAIFRGLDIGTAKPTPEEQRQVKHHLIDIANVGERFTVVEFQKLAIKTIEDISRRGKIPFLVGGTGLYVDAVLKGYQFPPEGDSELRYHLELESDERLLEMLKTLDPESYGRIDRHNRRRVIRALEVVFGTGRSFIRLRQTTQKAYNSLTIGLRPLRAVLYKRIDRRFDDWIDQGLIKEIRWALDETSPDWVSSLGLHYRALTQYLQGEIDKRDAFRQSKQALHALTKRQMTWFRRNKKINWVNSTNAAEILITTFLQSPSR